MRTSDRLRIAGVVFVFLWFFIGGIAHFAATGTEMRIVPPFIPWPRATVLLTGVFELLGALGVIRAKSRPAAGAGLLLLTLAVTPANVYMLQRWELFPIPYWALVARLPLQALLLVIIAWSTEVTGLFRPSTRASHTT
jgi:uncharacterized membrane protein